MNYDQLSKEDKERHDKFCSDIIKALNSLEGAADVINEMLDVTTEALDKGITKDTIHSIRL